MSEQSLIRVTAVEDDPIAFAVNDELVQVRELSHKQIMKFCAHMIKLLAWVPDHKVYLNSVCTASESKSVPALSMAHNCGSTFCVFGWMLAEKTGAEMIGLYPKHALETILVEDDFDAVNAYGERVPFMHAFSYGEKSWCASFLFNAAFLDEFEVSDKVEALARLAVVYATAKQAAADESLSVFQTEKFSNCDAHYAWQHLFQSGVAQTVPDVLKELLPVDGGLMDAIRSEWAHLEEQYESGEIAARIDPDEE